MSRIRLLNEAERVAMQHSGAWKPESPVGLERLRVVEISHHTFEGTMAEGRMTVLDAAAPYVAAIFKELADLEFPIHSVLPIEHFEASDDLSMAANNCTCYAFRAVYGATSMVRLSMHSYGVAVDINPFQNPYFFRGQYHPAAGEAYKDRLDLRPGMIEPVVPILEKHGFWLWGGHWEDEPDLHHFSIPRVLAPLLAGFSPDDARELFDAYVKAGKGLANFLLAQSADTLKAYCRQHRGDLAGAFRGELASPNLPKEFYQKLR